MKSVKEDFHEIEELTTRPELKDKAGDINMNKYHTELAKRGLQVLFIDDEADFKALKAFFSLYCVPQDAYYFKGDQMLILQLGKLAFNRSRTTVI